MARIDGKAVFIPFSLPGETLDIEITDRRKDYDFARVVSVLNPSPHRVAPKCPLFGRCGGCTLQMADSDYQKELRLSIVHDVFARARLVPLSGIEIESGNPFEYRSRFQFHRTGEGAIGLKEEKASSVIPVSDCPVAVKKIREGLKDGTLSSFARHFNSADRFHVFAFGDELWHEDGKTDCSVKIAGQDIRFDVRGFFQSNLPMLARMARAVSENASGSRLLDFYSGVGTFSVFAGPGFSETVLVEHNREALDIARTNLRHLGRPPVLCPTGDDAWPKRAEAKRAYDLAIVDPPRSGISGKALSWFIDSGIPDIRYVSCDPVTFARDAVKLVGAGYRLEKAVLFDFYPQTHHIETLGLFRK